MKKRIKNDEIDLIEVIINIWSNKFKIAVITVAFAVLSVIFFYLNKPPLSAKTEIIPISVFENNSYSSYNLIINDINLDKNENENILINPINNKYLLDLFITELNTKTIIVEAIKNFQLIDRKEFDNENDYLRAAEKKALSLNLFSPVKNSKKIEDKSKWTIEFKINDPKQWEETLSFIEKKININIQKYLKQNFNKNFALLKLISKFEIEDLNLKIKHARNDYQLETNNQLTFLREQALIARELNIASNPEVIDSTLEIQEFNSSSTVFNYLQSASPYYLRGFDIIEKEIELIENRTNKDAFTKELLNLEKKKRNLLEDKSLERIETLFNNTPINNDQNFKAASIFYKDTKYETSYSLLKTIVYGGVFGFIFGGLYIIITIAIQERKKN